MIVRVPRFFGRRRAVGGVRSWLSMTMRIGSRAPRQPRGELRIVGEHGADADEHRVVACRAGDGRRRAPVRR